MVCLTILLLLVSLIFSRKQIKSILELAEAADSFGRGKKLIVQYKPSGAREIRRAGIAFLKMKDRIERQVAKRTQMLAMISHDLRTPLTRMKLQLELMGESEETEGLKNDIETMKHMIDSYLAFAKGEEGESPEEVNLGEWLKELLEEKWSKYNIKFKDLKGNFNVAIKRQAFERAISNLLSNAVKYASLVKVSSYLDSSSVIITLEDNGAGISKEEQALVFNPFYRSDKSRSIGDSGSVGLGLAITKEIILSHGGKIGLEKSPKLGGLLVKITLPSL